MTRSSPANPVLEPSKTWVVEAVAEHRFWSTGAVVVSLRNRQITDVIDRVPIVGVSSTFDAPGNIGDGVRREAEVNLTVPTGRFGIAGGEVKSTFILRDSEVIDPTTGESRADLVPQALHL
jgi:outer membrane receptor protein involved in Fe transport